MFKLLHTILRALANDSMATASLPGVLLARSVTTLAISISEQPDGNVNQTWTTISGEILFKLLCRFMTEPSCTAVLLLVFTSSVDGAWLLHCLGQHTKSVVQRTLRLIQNLLSCSPQDDGAGLT